MKACNEKVSCKTLSIVTVTLNDAERLKKTIQSLSQFYNKALFEHIIIDGGSSDGTKRIVENLPSIKNLKFRSEKDGGIYDAMNKGLSLAQGKWVLFLNCGDIMLYTPEEVSNVLECCCVPDSANIVCFSYVLQNFELGGVFKADLNRKIRLPTSHQAMVFRRFWLLDKKFDISLRIAADYDLFWRAKAQDLCVAENAMPLTSIELEGVASSCATLSYFEYITVAWRRSNGINCLSLCCILILRYCSVILAKKLIPKSAFIKLRNLFS